METDKTNIISFKHDNQKQQFANILRRNMTLAERSLWTKLRQRRLAGLYFRRQQIIDGFIVDFYCHEAGLAVEVDGEIHNSTKDYDHDRDAIISARGILILRFTNDEITQKISHVIKIIKETADKRIAKK